MITLKIRTRRNDFYFTRVLTFSEVEVSYLNNSFTKIIEIDLKSDRNHLEVTDSGGELKVLEGVGETLVTEEVISFLIKNVVIYPDEIQTIGELVLGGVTC